MMTLVFVVFLIYLIASFVPSATSVDTMVEGLVKVESPFGVGFANLSLSLNEQKCLTRSNDLNSNSETTSHCFTDENGSCSLSFESGCPFEIRGKEVNPSFRKTKDSKPPMFSIVGEAPTTSNFKYTTYLGTMDELFAIYKVLDITYDPKAGVAVVGIDFSTDGSNDPSTLQPAVGASVTLTFANHSVVTSSTPFYYKYQVKPQFGNTIMPHSSSFLTFPNIPVDELIVTIDPGDLWKRCYVSPGDSTDVLQVNFSSAAETISIIAFICE